MARLAIGRDTYLGRAEIAAEALRQFDAGEDLSIRKLAAALGVSPAAIYHHFESRDEIVQAAVGLVWEETIADFLGSGPPSDPEEFLVGAAVAARRGFAPHYRIASNVSARPSVDTRLAGALAIFGALLERLGLRGDRAGAALFAYSTYTLGAILLSASRRLADEQSGSIDAAFSTADARKPDAPETSPDTTSALDQAVAATGLDDELEERHFVAGLRALIHGLVADA
jgi:AcrR family transcriptional regulator